MAYKKTRGPRLPKICGRCGDLIHKPKPAQKNPYSEMFWCDSCYKILNTIGDRL